jgi:hypothetical protein
MNLCSLRPFLTPAAFDPVLGVISQTFCNPWFATLSKKSLFARSIPAICDARSIEASAPGGVRLVFGILTLHPQA